jgi:hypothetical protein
MKPQLNLAFTGAFWIISLFFFAPHISKAQPEFPNPDIQFQQTHEGDLELTGNQMMTIENTHVIVSGDVILRDASKLILRQSILESPGHIFLRDSAFLQADTTIFGGANAFEEIDPSKAEMFKGGILYADFHSRVEMNNCFSQTQFFMGNSRITIKNSYLEKEPLGLMHAEGSTDILIEDSYVGAILLEIPVGEPILIDSLFPGYFEYWSIHEEISDKIPYNLILRRTELSENTFGYQGGMELGWNISLDAVHSDVMISNSVLNKIIIEFPQDEPVFLSDLAIRQPVDFDFNNIHVRNTEVQTQWGVVLNGGPAELTNSEGLWINMMGGDSDIIVYNSDVCEIDPWTYSGNLIFENSTWHSGYEIWVNSDINIRGSVRMLPSVPIFDSTSVLTRFYDVFLLHDSDGSPFSNIEMTLSKDNEQVWTGTTNADGKVELNIAFDFENFNDKWVLNTNDTAILLTKTLSIYNSNPVMINLEAMEDDIHYRNVMHVRAGDPEFPTGTRENPYPKIQEAIDNSGGNIIYVHAGTYTGDIPPGKIKGTINLKDSMSIIGDDPDSTIIDAIVIAEEISRAHLSGFTILDVVNSLFSSLKLTNNIIRDNSEIAIWGTYSDFEIVNNTIVNNSSDAIFLHDSCSASIRNNIIANNGNWGITGVENAETIIDYNNFWGNNGGDYFEFFQPGENDISENPLFVNAANNIYRLQPGSPCINTGDPDPIYNDIDGSRNDMGTYGGRYSNESVTGLKQTADIETQGNIYPNPVTNSISISLLPADLPATISLFTLNGQKLLTIEADDPHTEINLGQYKNGVYILKISSSLKTYSLKVIKN